MNALTIAVATLDLGCAACVMQALHNVIMQRDHLAVGWFSAAIVYV